MSHLDLGKFKTCRCGANVEDQSTQVKSRYTIIGWFWWIMGTTTMPKEVTFTCLKCGIVFEKITDKDLIKYYNFYRKH